MDWTDDDRRSWLTGERRRQVVILAIASTVAVLAGLFLRTLVDGGDGPAAGIAVGASVGDLRGEPVTRDLGPYDGLGAWVDAFDYVPAYAGGSPALDVTALDAMADSGVATVFLQVARDDERAEGLLVDHALVAAWLIEAHARDLAVVAWYLPGLVDLERDFAFLDAVRTYEVLGHRFDGIAVDIESTDVEDPVDRGRRLVDLSKLFAAVSGDDVLGAIVLPPVLLEVVNPAFWPSFPWRELAEVYDIWLPMTYWTDRTSASGYRDGYRYVEESVRRLRANLGDGAALVHGIGGIGDALADDDLERFATAIDDTGAVGASIYDWATLPVRQRDLVAAAAGP